MFGIRLRSLWPVLVVFGMGCQTGPTVEQQSEALTLAADNLSLRQVQSRRFNTGNESMILSASAGVLQDLGFTIEESAANAGLLVASKDRDAVEAGQVAGQVFFALLITALGGQADPVWDKNQKIRISIVTQLVNSGTVFVRVTFQRIIWNTKDQVSKVETISDAKIYQEFFDKLSQSVFLEGHKI